MRLNLNWSVRNLKQGQKKRRRQLLQPWGRLVFNLYSKAWLFCLFGHERKRAETHFLFPPFLNPISLVSLQRFFFLERTCLPSSLPAYPSIRAWGNGINEIARVLAFSLENTFPLKGEEGVDFYVVRLRVVKCLLACFFSPFIPIYLEKSTNQPRG